MRFCCDFSDTEELALRLDRVKERLSTIQDKYPDITWCIENDFPLFGAGLMFAESMAYLEAPLCLDVSHLWISCLLLARDFIKQIEVIADTDRMKCVHLHANPCTSLTPLEQLRDSHISLSNSNEMDLPEMI